MTEIETLTEQERADLNRCAALVTKALDSLEKASTVAVVDIPSFYTARVHLRQTHAEFEARCAAAREEARDHG